MSAASEEQQPEEAVASTIESASLNQDENIKRKIPEPDAAGYGGLSAETSPTKRIKTEPNEVEAEPVTTPVKVKEEPADGNPSAASVSSNSFVTVKTEPADTEPTQSTDQASANNAPAPADTSGTTSVVVKTEPTQGNGPTSVNDAPAIVSSSTLRPSCRFGIRCYRRNPAHRDAEAHPGDDDYRRPDYPEPPLGTPACPFGNLCYRRNPVHFQQHSHPPDFNSAQNIRNRLRQRRRVQQQQNDPDSDLNSEDEEDPFAGDSNEDEEYRPEADIDDDDDDGDDDEELEFDSQRVNCDQYD